MRWEHEVLLISQKCPSLWERSSSCGPGRRCGQEAQDISCSLLLLFPVSEEEAAGSDWSVYTWPSYTLTFPFHFLFPLKNVLNLQRTGTCHVSFLPQIIAAVLHCKAFSGALAFFPSKYTAENTF